MRKDEIFERLGQVVFSDIIPPLFTARGNIEALVRKGRTPVSVGSMGHWVDREGFDSLEYETVYGVPPIGHKIEGDVTTGVDCGGTPVSVDEEGKQSRLKEYRVSAERSRDINLRIKAAQEKLSE